jgi:hypothetical protein
MIYDFENLRPKPKYPVYPKYHTGLYLEDYCFQYFKEHREEFDKSGRLFIPVFWTSLYVDGTFHNVQEYLNALDPSKKYWTLVQHDESVRQNLPPDTTVFAAGGLGKGGIPIPLICSRIPQNLIEKNRLSDNKKDIFCSFIGSMTHPIRKKLYQTYSNNPNFVFNSLKPWSQSINDEELDNFINITHRSQYSLCPRGHSFSSFRLYEILQLNSIPVYVSDKHWLPFADELNWSDFCVIIKEDQIPELENILLSISEEKQNKMLDMGKEVYKSHFTLESVCNEIRKRL